MYAHSGKQLFRYARTVQWKYKHSKTWGNNDTHVRSIFRCKKVKLSFAAQIKAKHLVTAVIEPVVSA